LGYRVVNGCDAGTPLQEDLRGRSLAGAEIEYARCRRVDFGECLGDDRPIQRPEGLVLEMRGTVEVRTSLSLSVEGFSHVDTSSIAV
jgi:hypothetical protein